MKAFATLTAAMLLVVALSPRASWATPAQQINALENQVRQLQQQLQQSQAQVQQLQQQLQQAQLQAQTQLQQSQAQLQQSQAQVQQLQQLQQSQNANQTKSQPNNSAISQSNGGESTLTMVNPIATTPASELHNALNAVPADMLPKAGDTAAQRGEKIAKIKSFLNGKLADHNARITGKLNTASISLTNKDHLYVELAPIEDKDVTWQLHGVYLPAALAARFQTMPAGSMIEIDAQASGCDVRDISGPGSTHPVLELTLNVMAADAHKPE